MKIKPPKSRNTAITHASMLEKLEILRSTLRWAKELDRPEIQKLLKQCNDVRSDVMQLSQGGAGASLVEKARKSKRKRRSSASERRQALLDRSFVFEGVFGDNAKLLASLEISERAARTDLPVIAEQSPHSASHSVAGAAANVPAFR